MTATYDENGRLAVSRAVNGPMATMTPEQEKNFEKMLEKIDQAARSKYHREIKPGVWVDVYDVLNAWGGVESRSVASSQKGIATQPAWAQGQGDRP